MSSSVETANNKSAKLAWKAEEDAKLMQLVETYGTDGRWYLRIFQFLIRDRCIKI